MRRSPHNRKTWADNPAAMTAILCILLFPALSVSAQEGGSGGGTNEDSFGGWPKDTAELGSEAGVEEFGPEGVSAGGSISEFGEATSLYGYVKSTTRLGLELFPGDGTAGGLQESNDSYSFGASTLFRLKGDWEPEERVSAHIEIDFETNRGYLNPYGYREASGLDALTEAGGGTTAAQVQTENPQDDFHSKMTIDHAWGLIIAGPLDLKIGKMPVAWGTAYAFNPLARVHSEEDFGGSQGEETHGSTGIMPSLQLGGPFSLTGYLLYEDKSRSAPAGENGGNIDNYPFGLKLQGYSGRSDFSLAFVKEVLYLGPSGSSIDPLSDEYRRWYFLGGEVFTSIGDGGLYAEAACRLPGENGIIDFTDKYDITEFFEAAVGTEYSLQGGTSLRAEYYYHGRGEVEKEEYRVFGLLSGELPMLGRDYLFARVSHTYFDYLELSLAGLGNLNDGSFAALPEASYALRPNVQLTASAILPYGSEGSELDGRFDLLPGIAPPVDLVNGGVHMEVKVSF